jgi:branched-subunit amino acid transport protein AzlD
VADGLIFHPGGLHMWRRNAVLSILGGTVIYAVPVGTLLAG